MESCSAPESYDCEVRAAFRVPVTRVGFACRAPEDERRDAPPLNFDPTHHGQEHPLGGVMTAGTRGAPEFGGAKERDLTMAASARSARELKLTAPRSSAPILMYHSISDLKSGRFDDFRVTPQRFQEHLRLFRSVGMQPLTVSQLVEARELDHAPERPVVLTFDDGFVDFYEHAMPILSRFGFTATLYMLAGQVGGASMWLENIGEGELPLMNWTQLETIQQAGVEVGAHSMTHRALDMLPLNEAREEIARSKQILEAGLARPVTSFAYPFGFFSRRVRNLVEESGFRSACAVGYATSASDQDVFALSRHIVRSDTSDQDLLTMIHDESPTLQTRIDRLRSGLWASARHSLYRCRP